MKFFIKQLLQKISQNRLGWFLFKPVVTLGTFLSKSRKGHLKKIKRGQSSEQTYVQKYKLNLVTQSGPFKGLKYPFKDSVGSAIFPKLLGSYEKELWPTIYDLIRSNDYQEIIDIGCAEGYYAIGLGKIFKTSKIYAFDTDARARKLCRQMAEINHISERIHVKEKCTSKTLKKFNFQGKGLIICDCEGFEKDLFNSENVQNLHNCDLIIETHDFIDINISSVIKDVFQNTHDIYSVKSIDDIEKAHTYVHSALENASLEEKKYFFSEYRPAIMEWVVCKSRIKINTLIK